MKKDLE